MKKSNITDFNGLHDVLLEIDGKSRNVKELIEIFLTLPKSIQNIAHEWTCSDIVFGDLAYCFLKNNLPKST